MYKNYTFLHFHYVFFFSFIPSGIKSILVCKISPTSLDRKCSILDFLVIFSHEAEDGAFRVHLSCGSSPACGHDLPRRAHSWWLSRAGVERPGRLGILIPEPPAGFAETSQACITDRPLLLPGLFPHFPTQVLIPQNIKFTLLETPTLNCSPSTHAISISTPSTLGTQVSGPHHMAHLLAPLEVSDCHLLEDCHNTRVPPGFPIQPPHLPAL